MREAAQWCGEQRPNCSVLDGASRAIVHWDLRESMTEADVERILLRAHELHPGEKQRVISDNGPQFIAKDFHEFIRLTGYYVAVPDVWDTKNQAMPSAVELQREREATRDRAKVLRR